jgi:hypothetical protein
MNKPSYNFKDLTNKTFGRLKVLKRVENDSFGKSRWLCQCECGNKKIITACSLGRRTKSCGCLHKEKLSKLNFKNLKNKRFGRLKVISRLKNDDYNQIVWKCKCDCGNICNIISRSLIHNRTKSCGCLHKDVVRKEPYYHLFTALNRSSKNRGRECSITFQQFLSFVEINKCHYCNDKIEWFLHRELNKGNGHHYNLDRKDNKIGYTLENCVVCCPRCNYMKGTLSYEEFYNFTKPIRDIKKDINNINDINEMVDKISRGEITPEIKKCIENGVKAVGKAIPFKEENYKLKNIEKN